MVFTYLRDGSSIFYGTSGDIGSIVHVRVAIAQSYEPMRSDVTVAMPLGLPIIAEGLDGHQLGGRVR